MTTVLGVAGSPRRGGNSDVLLRHIAEGAEHEGASVQTVQLRDYFIRACIGCERCRRDGTCTGLMDGMQLLYPRIAEADGLVLVSPTHFYNVSSLMKTFIDRLYSFFIFTDDRPRQWRSRLADQHKRALIAAVCEQPGPEDMGFTLDAMRLPLVALGYRIVAELPVFGVFDRGAVAREPGTVEKARDCGRSLATA